MLWYYVKIHKLNKKSQIRKENLQKAQESLRNKEKISERRKKIHCSEFCVITESTYQIHYASIYKAVTKPNAQESLTNS